MQQLALAATLLLAAFALGALGGLLLAAVRSERYRPVVVAVAVTSGVLVTLTVSVLLLRTATG